MISYWNIPNLSFPNIFLIKFTAKNFMFVDLRLCCVWLVLVLLIITLKTSTILHIQIIMQHTRARNIASFIKIITFFRKQDFIIWVGYYSSVCSNLLLKADTRKLSYSNVVSSIKLYTQIWKLLPVQFYKSLVQNCKSNNPVLLIIKKECISQTIHIYLNRLKFSVPSPRHQWFVVYVMWLLTLTSSASHPNFMCFQFYLFLFFKYTEIAKKQHFWNSFAF